jgi:hypothetical protein
MTPSPAASGQAMVEGALRRRPVRAIPLGDQPIALHVADEGPDAGKHFVGLVAIGYGLLITPTCDMAEQRTGA